MMGLWSLVLAVLIVSAKPLLASLCQETMTLMPCDPYLVGNDTSPNPPCCAAAQEVSREATTKEVRKRLCECFKLAIPTFGVNTAKAKRLPQLCNVDFPVPIGPDVDCSK
ncbi:hypothetical protein JCGZ_21157 [Jatropha curcas]|uniref:Non-specific lipid-transfer protein n=2 Tax=Jatropha curcas TaxID=180498 RepID=A0A067JA90_JATCU|nr:hypothetical protein JCGZ_21157 [Jatropha curcas]